MITLLTLFCLLSTYAFYQLSEKALLSQSAPLALWLQSNHIRTKIIAAVSAVGFITFNIFYLGITTGIIFSLFSYMTLFSLLIVLSPLNIIKYKYLLGVYILALFFEIIL